MSIIFLFTMNLFKIRYKPWFFNL